MKFIIFSIFLGSIFPSSIFAEAITQQTALSFGTIALRDNASSHQMSISFDGSIIADPAFIIITQGNPAEFLLSGFTANTLININILVPSTTTMLAGATDPSSSQFTIDNHHSFAPIVTTNLLGEATINIGARLTTSGIGFYKDSMYIAPMTISVSY
ncbi:MAG: hypothetical protein ACI9LM_003125 [Alteromonadaceae bacterium]|jgi:hypothetical protein